MNLDLDIKDVPDQDLETNVYPAIEKGEDFLNKSICSPPIVIDGLLRMGEVAILSGESKSNKSWAALQLGVCIVNGLEFLGLKTNSDLAPKKRGGAFWLFGFMALGGFEVQRGFISKGRV